MSTNRRETGKARALRVLRASEAARRNPCLTESSSPAARFPVLGCLGRVAGQQWCHLGSVAAWFESRLGLIVREFGLKDQLRHLLLPKGTAT
jgi:hypothetical protein